VTAAETAGDPAQLAEARIRAGRLVAIVRVPRLTPDTTRALTDVLVDAGVQAFEFTLDSDGALEAVGVAREVAGERAAVGAGTVLHPHQVDDAAAAGAQFIVSPDVCPGVITRTVALGLLALPGAFTATEVRRAVDLGAGLVKLFPAQPGGATYLRALRGPLPDVGFVPTGGIQPDDVAELLEAGATAVALGSSLVRSADDRSGLAERAGRAVAAALRG
jgi:2-dehydro-3-deoxyphosphogluconate aldolase/(4S)-4-hydroxy-2-oxoglutarate aldolase